MVLGNKLINKKPPTIKEKHRNILKKQLNRYAQQLHSFPKALTAHCYLELHWKIC